MEEITRQEMEVDVAIVGGGAAGMSAAIHLQNLIKKHNDQVQATGQGQAIPEKMIVVLEKAAEVGNHSFSGAVLNPVALREMIPDYKEKGCPIDAEVTYDAAYYLGEKFKFKIPITPPPFHNKGNYILSLSKLNRWLGTQAES